MLLFGAVYKLYDFPEESSAEVSRTQTWHLQTSSGHLTKFKPSRPKNGDLTWKIFIGMKPLTFFAGKFHGVTSALAFLSIFMLIGEGEGEGPNASLNCG